MSTAKKYSDALDWIEAHLPGGIQIVSAAMSDVPPDECPALVQIVQKLRHRPFQCVCNVCVLNYRLFKRG